jgi:hypothetical protein
MIHPIQLDWNVITLQASEDEDAENQTYSQIEHEERIASVHSI